MFISHSDGKTTSTIRVNAVQDLLWAIGFFTFGLALVCVSIAHPMQNAWELVLGLVLLLAGIGLGDASIRLIVRASRAYLTATSWEKK
jgi:hypothetical protein